MPFYCNEFDSLDPTKVEVACDLAAGEVDTVEAIGFAGLLSKLQAAEDLLSAFEE